MITAAWVRPSHSPSGQVGLPKLLNAGVKNGFQLLPGTFIVENNSGQCFAVQFT